LDEVRFPASAGMFRHFIIDFMMEFVFFPAMAGMFRRFTMEFDFSLL
jgi:hypothetical protein